ncbi:MAG: threonine--tRNA ligase, partial [Candidatus Omnitrophota bacterium]
DFVIDTLNAFGFDDFSIELSTRPAKSIGTDEDWELAEAALISSLNRKQLNYEINEGEGAFYGPKIDIKLRDALKREWQCATIQCDFTLPERFDLKYVGQDGKEYRPIMLHRVILGSLERFMGALIEHFAGALPLWLSPVQCMIIPVSDKVSGYAENIKRTLLGIDMRVEIDFRNERLQKKIRDAEVAKTPYMLVIGEKEESIGMISVRSKTQGDMGRMKLSEFVEKVKEEIEKKVR